VDPDRLPDAVVCYTDSTIALPLLTAYALTRREPREPKRLYRRRDAMMQRLRDEYARSERNEAVQERARHETHEVTLDRNR
jgi:deoxyhypusine synthase